MKEQVILVLLFLLCFSLVGSIIVIDDLVQQNRWLEAVVADLQEEVEQCYLNLFRCAHNLTHYKEMAAKYYNAYRERCP